MCASGGFRLAMREISNPLAMACLSRVYFLRLGELIGLLLIGGDKRSQDQDIRTAKKLAKDYGNAA
jgi:hypothetical protein